MKKIIKKLCSSLSTVDELLVIVNRCILSGSIFLFKWFIFHWYICNYMIICAILLNVCCESDRLTLWYHSGSVSWYEWRYLFWVSLEGAIWIIRKMWFLNLEIRLCNIVNTAIKKADKRIWYECIKCSQASITA